MDSGLWAGPPDAERRAGGSLASTLIPALLAILAACGVARELRVRSVAGPLLVGLGDLHNEEAVSALAARISERLIDIQHNGPRGVPWPGYLRTATATLLEGGSCGGAALALAAILDLEGVPQRIVLSNVRSYGASHVLVEARLDTGQWVLVDAFAGRIIRHPATGKALALEELPALAPEDRSRLPAQYQDPESWFLFGRNEYTIWENYGTAGRLIRSVTPAGWWTGVSLKSWVIEPGFEVATLSMLALLALRLRASRVKRSRA